MLPDHCTRAQAAIGHMQRALAPQTSLLRPATAQGRAGRRAVAPAAFFKFPGTAKPAKAAVKRETIIPKPSYNLPAALIGIAGASHFAHVDGLSVAAGVLGVFLAVQASRVQFVFDDEALEVVIGKQQEQSENVFVGGRNRWAYSSFTNWEFWWPGFPVLVYFKETQTKPEGQIHFFPIIFDGKQLYDVMVERCGPSQTSGPKN